MGYVKINEQSLSGAADAIRRKNGTQTTYYPSQFENAIDAIPTEPIFDLSVIDKQIKMVIELTPDDIDPLECGITFFQTVANDITIDWGDGTIEQSDTRINGDIYHHTRYLHTYSSYGKKLVTLTANDGSLSLPTNSYLGGSYLINSGKSLTNNAERQNYNWFYNKRLKKLAIGNQIVLANYSLYGYPDLSEINRFTYSPANSNIPANTLINTKSLIIPEGLTTIQKSQFITFGTSGRFQYVKFPSTLQSIGANAFTGQSCVKTYDFTSINLNANNELPFTVQSNSFNQFNTAVTKFLFATQEIADVAKQTTNLSQYGDNITYEGAE